MGLDAGAELGLEDKVGGGFSWQLWSLVTRFAAGLDLDEDLCGSLGVVDLMGGDLDLDEGGSLDISEDGSLGQGVVGCRCGLMMFRCKRVPDDDEDGFVLILLKTGAEILFLKTPLAVL